MKMLFLALAFFCLCPHSFAQGPDINQAYRVYSAETGELVLNVGFEPKIVKKNNQEYVSVIVCDMRRFCAPYEFQESLFFVKVPANEVFN